jgi:molybdopterin molybdotransferase
VPTGEALDRVLAAPIIASGDLPSFPRSTVDGYAVRAQDTHGASSSQPAYLQLVGEAAMGSAPAFRLGPGEAALIHTGAMMPQGSDAVVMVEDTQIVSDHEIEVLAPVAAGQNMLAVGEDVRRGEAILDAGVRLRPGEIGGLMALGITEIAVARRPQVGIISTGDEVVPPSETPGPGQVRDVNSYSLAAVVARQGAIPELRGIVRDDRVALEARAREAHKEDDLVLITAGSSVSARDITAQVIDRLGKPGILVHGVSIKPGQPTILAVADGKPVIGLPGNPVSAVVVGELLVAPVVRRLLGERAPAPRPRVAARLKVNLPSMAGREDYVPVRLEVTPAGVQAEPVFGRSNLIFTLVRAHGLVRIPAESTGLPAGDRVEVWLL